MGISLSLLFVLALILAAEFVNGWNDAANAIATVVSTRVLSPIVAVGLACLFNIIGALSGTAVAATIGKGIVNPDVVNLSTVAAGVLSVVIWGGFASWVGLPISISHSLIGGLAGAALGTGGVKALQVLGFKKVFLGIGFSTFLGFLGGWVLMVLLYRILATFLPGTIRRVFGKLQLFSAALMAFSHGSNDGQKFIGVFSLALFLGGVYPEFHVPLWVILLCAVTMGAGTSIGGMRVIKTMGLGLTKLEPVHGFAAETGAALTIEIASRFGIPLSTTHTIATSIMGVGATRRFSAVRWGVTRDIVIAWFLTFPLCGVIGWVVIELLRLTGIAAG